MSEESFPFEFHCRRSGNCCSIPGGVVRISDSEAEGIRTYLGMTAAAFRSRFLAPGGDRLADGPGHRCVFLVDGKESACGIYPVRPRKCATWPYWDELRDNPAAIARAMRLCPGITRRSP